MPQTYSPSGWGWASSGWTARFVSVFRSRIVMNVYEPTPGPPREGEGVARGKRLQESPALLR